MTKKRAVNIPYYARIFTWEDDSTKRFGRMEIRVFPWSWKTHKRKLKGDTGYVRNEQISPIHCWLDVSHLIFLSFPSPPSLPFIHIYIYHDNHRNFWIARKSFVYPHRYQIRLPSHDTHSSTLRYIEINEIPGISSMSELSLILKKIAVEVSLWILIRIFNAKYFDILYHNI